MSLVTAPQYAWVLGYLPQALATIRTRNTDGISLTAFIMLALASIFFVVQAV